MSRATFSCSFTNSLFKQFGSSSSSSLASNDFIEILDVSEERLAPIIPEGKVESVKFSTDLPTPREWAMTLAKEVPSTIDKTSVGVAFPSKDARTSNVSLEEGALLVAVDIDSDNFSRVGEGNAASIDPMEYNNATSSHVLSPPSRASSEVPVELMEPPSNKAVTRDPYLV
ncbi:hypothetical protein I3843_14G086700 [Carya illinoinensis]|nr:hypothetical protein I3843_14G086700 [Carya illinoinensis]